MKYPIMTFPHLLEQRLFHKPETAARFAHENNVPVSGLRILRGGRYWLAPDWLRAEVSTHVRGFKHPEEMAGSEVSL